MLKQTTKHTFHKKRCIEGQSISFAKDFSDETILKEACSIYDSLFVGFNDKSVDDKKLIANEMKRRLEELKAADNQTKTREKELKKRSIQRTSSRLSSSSAADQQSEKINKMSITSDDKKSDNSSAKGGFDKIKAFFAKSNKSILNTEKTNEEKLIADCYPNISSSCPAYSIDLANDPFAILTADCQTADDVYKARANYWKSFDEKESGSKSENLPRSDNTNINMAGNSKNLLVGIKVAETVQIVAGLFKVDIMRENFCFEDLKELVKVSLQDLTGLAQVPPDVDVLLAEPMEDYASACGQMSKFVSLVRILNWCRTTKLI